MPHCSPVKIKNVMVQRATIVTVMRVRALKMVRWFGTQKIRRKKSRALILTPPRVVIEKKSKAMYSCSEISLGSLRDQTGGLPLMSLQQFLPLLGDLSGWDTP